MAGNKYAWSTTAATNATADSTINWAEGQLPGTVNDSARAMMAVEAAELGDINATSTTGGSANAYTVTSNLTPASLATGLRLRLKINATNTGASTLTVTPNGASAFSSKAIKVLGMGGERDPLAAELRANCHAEFNYDAAANGAAGAWILLNPCRGLSQTIATTYTPSNPTGTTSTAGKMMGLGSTCVITPVASTRALVAFSGSITNDTGADGATFNVRYGTGAAPANAAAITGTQAGSSPQYNPVSGASNTVPFCQVVVITGLTVGTAYWLDLVLAAITGGTATVTNVTCSVCEV